MSNPEHSRFRRLSDRPPPPGSTGSPYHTDSEGPEGEYAHETSSLLGRSLRDYGFSGLEDDDDEEEEDFIYPTSMGMTSDSRGRPHDLYPSHPHQDPSMYPVDRTQSAYFPSTSAAYSSSQPPGSGLTVPRGPVDPGSLHRMDDAHGYGGGHPISSSVFPLPLPPNGHGRSAARRRGRVGEGSSLSTYGGVDYMSDGWAGPGGGPMGGPGQMRRHGPRLAAQANFRRHKRWMRRRQGNYDEEQQALLGENNGLRVWYDDYTTIDWIHDHVKERVRLRRIRSLRGFRGWLVASYDSLSAWMILFLVGVACGCVAAGMDISSRWLSDLKLGYCRSNPMWNRDFCCWGYADPSTCEDWSSWSQIFLGWREDSQSLTAPGLTHPPSDPVPLTVPSSIRPFYHLTHSFPSPQSTTSPISYTWSHYYIDWALYVLIGTLFASLAAALVQGAGILPSSHSLPKSILAGRRATLPDPSMVPSVSSPPPDPTAIPVSSSSANSSSSSLTSPTADPGGLDASPLPTPGHSNATNYHHHRHHHHHHHHPSSSSSSSNAPSHPSSKKTHPSATAAPAGVIGPSSALHHPYYPHVPYYSSPSPSPSSPGQGEKKVKYFAAGSGIPEVKTILSGFVIRGFLGIQTLWVKVVGLTLSVASGLSLGRQGPLVHIACCIGNVMCRIARKYNKNEGKKREILSAAAAAGVAVAFGAPIGGVLFSLEEVSYYFPSKTMWRSFFCALIAAATLRLINPWQDGRLVLFQVTYERDWHLFDLPFFLLLGVLGGLYGALFTRLYRRWMGSRLHIYLAKFPIRETALVAAITGIVCYTNPFSRMGLTELVALLFSECTPEEDLEGLCARTMHQFASTTLLLLLTLLSKFLLTLVTLGLKVPAGVFIPSMAVGACGGRVLGLLVQWYHAANPSSPFFSSCAGEGCVMPGVYAMIGAASTLTGVTRMTVSLVVIMFELTGSLTYLLPAMLSVMVAKWVADGSSRQSLYDFMIDMNGHPYLNAKREYLRVGLTSEVLERGLEVMDVAEPNTVGDLLGKLARLGASGYGSDGGFPVVENDRLIGYIASTELEHALAKIRLRDTNENIRCHFKRPHHANRAANILGDWSGDVPGVLGDPGERVPGGGGPHHGAAGGDGSLFPGDRLTDFTAYMDRVSSSHSAIRRRRGRGEGEGTRGGMYPPPLTMKPSTSRRP